MKRLMGIDYGAKLAGTTAVCYNDGDSIVIHTSVKKKDADAFIMRLVKDYQPEIIAIDAPLSLPAAYSTGQGSFFYRKADEELKAMSPMFLGGLTARAMKLRRDIGIQTDVIETYPAAAIRHLSLDDYYQKKDKSTIEKLMYQMRKKLPITIDNSPSTYHEVDAVIAWLTAYHYSQGSAIAIGDVSEGQIWL